MSLRKEIRVSGSGGQGIILISKVLAEAAAVYEDLNATQTQSYGPEARGGSSRADVIISDEDIDYPKAEHLDVLMSLTQEACNQYVRDLKPGGILVYSTCTLNTSENEAVVANALETLPLEVEQIPLTVPGGLPGFTNGFPRELSRALRILPAEDWEGFFVCRMRKK